MGNWNPVEILWTLIAIVSMPFALYCLREARADAASAKLSSRRVIRRRASAAWMTSDATMYVLVLLGCIVVGFFAGSLPDRQIDIAPDDPYVTIMIPASLISALCFFMMEIATSWAMLNSIRQRHNINTAAGRDIPVRQPSDLGMGWLFWASRDAIVIADVDTGTVVLWNPEAEALWGYTARQAIGLSIESLMPERFRYAHRQGLKHFAATEHGELIDQREPFSVAILRPDGRELPVDLMLGVVPLAGGAARYVVAIIRERAPDLTALPDVPADPGE